MDPSSDAKSVPIPRRTLARPAVVRSVGLFNAVDCGLEIRPARGGDGLVFMRADLPGQPRMRAVASAVCPAPRRTMLASRRADGTPDPVSSVQTVEHVLSALTAAGVTDGVLAVTGPEVPMADGSSEPFLSAILAAGVVECDGAASVLTVRERIELSAGEGPAAATVIAEPLAPGSGSDPRLELVYELDYGPGAPLPPQRASVSLRHAAPDAARYAREIAPARTFCTADEAAAMRARGMFAHLGPGAVLVLGPQGPLGTALRFGDEPARHKLLDLIGDLALAGGLIHGRITARRSGHELNQRLAGQIAAQNAG